MIYTQGNHKVLSRKYRPSRLCDLVGQDIVVDTISNAITLDRIHHAFLFTGTRGVGKTTSARILALSLNCQNENTPTTKPCLKCDSCIAILNGNNPDVIEFDAASNTGVDSIRDLIEKCNFPPIVSRYKVYIIDEVHMLSKSAFNALLKTLEEPPEKIKFIFATTESRKVPVTVMSRCQKFFLKNITVGQIASYLQRVCENENVSACEEIFNIIAKHADGSMRDALSLLDQAISMSSDSKIQLDVVKKMLLLADKVAVASLFYNLYLGNIKESLEILNQIFVDSDVNAIVSSLLEVICDAMQFLAKIEVDSIEAKEKFILLNNAELLDMPRLLRMWQVLTNSLPEMKFISPKNYFTSLFFKICYCSNLPTPVEMLKLIDNQNLQVALSHFPNSKIVK
jgi:DNA polymerase-3 subunit gamma/tau